MQMFDKYCCVFAGLYFQREKDFNAVFNFISGLKQSLADCVKIFCLQQNTKKMPFAIAKKRKLQHSAEM